MIQDLLLIWLGYPLLVYGWQWRPSRTWPVPDWRFCRP